MIYGQILKEEDESTLQALQKKQTISKIRSVNNYIQNLLQKKIRIDLEIRRQKKVLSKLKKQSEFSLKTTLKLEGNLPIEEIRPLTQEECNLLRENSELFNYTKELDQEIDISDQLLEEITQLETFLFEEP